MYKKLAGKILVTNYLILYTPQSGLLYYLPFKPVYDDFSSTYYRAKTDPAYTNVQFTTNIESVQYNVALAITGCCSRFF